MSRGRPFFKGNNLMANALSTVDHLHAVADRFFGIANLIHRQLNCGKVHQEPGSSWSDLHGLLIEEYGLRARAAILRNDAAAHLISNCSIQEAELLAVLEQAAEAIPNIRQVYQLRSLIAGISTLCVGISPGKGHVVEFLAAELKKDVHRISQT